MHLRIVILLFVIIISLIFKYYFFQLQYFKHQLLEDFDINNNNISGINNQQLKNAIQDFYSTKSVISHYEDLQKNIGGSDRIVLTSADPNYSNAINNVINKINTDILNIEYANTSYQSNLNQVNTNIEGQKTKVISLSSQIANLTKQYNDEIARIQSENETTTRIINKQPVLIKTENFATDADDPACIPDIGDGYNALNTYGKAKNSCINNHNDRVAAAKAAAEAAAKAAAEKAAAEAAAKAAAEKAAAEAAAKAAAEAAAKAAADKAAAEAAAKAAAEKAAADAAAKAAADKAAADKAAADAAIAAIVKAAADKAAADAAIAAIVKAEADNPIYKKYSAFVYLPLNSDNKTKNIADRDYTVIILSKTWHNMYTGNSMYFDNNRSNHIAIPFPLLRSPTPPDIINGKGNYFTDFTFCFWINIVDNQYYTAVSITDGVNPLIQCEFQDNNIYYIAEFKNRIRLHYSKPNTLINNWTHVAYTCHNDKSSPYIELYVNGSLIETKYGEKFLGINKPNLFHDFKILIGKSGDDKRSVKGYIREFYFFEQMLNRDNIKDIYNRTKP